MNLVPDLVLRTKIKEEEDNASNIIDLELDKSPEDLVYEWNSKVRLKFKNYSTIDNEHSLDILMKWYIKTIEEEAVNLEDVHNLKLFTTNHIQFLKLSFLELNCCFVDNYLDNMEEILSFYVNLEVKSIPAKKKEGNKRAYKRLLVSVCHKVISILNLYLLKRDDRIYQVIMKVKLNSLSEESKDLLNLLYGNFLTKRPKDKSDLGFCRAYILYQKWKTIKKSEDWEKMDEVMYNLHERTSDSIKSNPILKQILLPQSNSILDTLTHISENHLIIAKEYFKYIKSNKIQHDNIMASGIGNIDMQDDDIAWDSVGDAEDQEFESAYKNFVKSMSSIHLEKDQSITVKSESASESEDCEIVSVSFVENDSEDIIHEILDDDDDDIEIIYRKKKDDKQKTPRKDEGKSATLSFLESIEATHSRDVSTERVSSSTNNGCTEHPSTNNSVETSRNAKVVTADSPTSSFTQKKLTETPNTTVVTSVAQTEPLQEATSLGSELNNVSSKNEQDVSHTSEENSGDDLAVSNVLESNVSPVEKKSVASIETQTDEWLTDDGQEKLPLEKQAQQNGYYYYGLDTPPFDQRPEEHISPVTESSAYSNVYVNIVSPNEPSSLAKATDTDSLSSSADDNDIDNNGKILSRFDDLTPTSPVQNKGKSSEYDQKLIDSPYMHKVEVNTKKKHKKSKKASENDPNLLDEAFIPYVKPNTKKKRRKMDEPPEDYSNGLGVAFIPDIDPNAKKKRKVLDKTPENDLNLLDSSVEVSKKKKRKKSNEPPDVELKSKKKRKKSNKLSENETVLVDVEANTKSRKSCKPLDFEPLCSSQQPRSSRGVAENVVFHDPTREHCSIAEGASTRENTTDLQNISSLGISTTEYLDAYSCQQNSRSPYNYRDNDVCETSTNVPCTSLDFIVTSAESIEIAFNDQSQLPDVPDVTSTSTDVQDFVRTDFGGNDQSYGQLNEDMLEIEEHGVNDVGYCLEYTVYDNSENVTQSNIEDVVEEAIVVQNNFSEDISDTGHNSVAIGEGKHAVYVKEIEIPMEKVTSMRKVTFATQEEIEEPSVDEFLRVERWSKLKETHCLDEAFSGPVTKLNQSDSCVNPDTNFDLFSTNFTTDCGPSPSNFSVQSTSEVTSPAYEGIDDFRTYYEENRNSAGAVTPSTSRSCAEESVVIVAPEKIGDTDKVTRTLEVVPGVSQSPVSVEPSSEVVPASPRETEARSKPVKKVLIRDTIVSSRNSVPQLATDNAKKVHLRSILKKSPQKTKEERGNMRVPPCHMNLRSLKLYGVQPNDECLQKRPVVDIKPLTSDFINRCLSINDIAQEVRLRKLNWGASPPIKVDYNKQISPRIGTDDVVEYVVDGKSMKRPLLEGLGEWRCGSVGRPDEGTVTTKLNDNDSTNIPQQCTNSCFCDYMSVLFVSNVQLDNSQNVVNLESNAKSIESNSTRVESQQPAVVPEVVEFEKTLKLEDVVPSDLLNLNLQQFSPSPCFSPTHTFPTDTYLSEPALLSDKPAVLSDADDKLDVETPELIKLEAPSKTDTNVPETRLPLKKRKLSMANAKEEAADDDFLDPDSVEEIIKRARAEELDKEDISYPAKPMISIAEIQEKLVDPHPRVFKTPAERKEMPPPPPQAFESPRIVTEQYNNHTYNNPTINYHMNNVPYPFFPCASLPYFPPILLPMNSTTTFDMNLVNAQQPAQRPPAQRPPAQEPACRPKRERTRGRRKNT